MTKHYCDGCFTDITKEVETGTHKTVDVPGIWNILTLCQDCYSKAADIIKNISIEYNERKKALKEWYHVEIRKRLNNACKKENKGEGA